MEWPEEMQLPHQYHLWSCLQNPDLIFCPMECQNRAQDMNMGCSSQHSVDLTRANASVLTQTLCLSRPLAHLCRDINAQLGFLAVARFLSGIFNSEA